MIGVGAVRGRHIRAAVRGCDHIMNAHDEDAPELVASALKYDIEDGFY